MASRDPALLTPELQRRWPLLKQGYEAEHPGMEVRLTCTYRSPQEQFEAWQQGRTKPGKRVTNIDGKTRMGNHNYSPARAFDVGLFTTSGEYITDDTKYDELRRYADSLGLAWGGSWVSFKDKPHFEAGEQTMLFGRKWILKRIVNYAADPRNATRIAEWADSKIDIPGVSDEMEKRMSLAITTNTFALIRDFLDGKNDGEFEFSKRYVVLKMLNAMANNLVHAVDAINIPWLADASKKAVAEALTMLITQELIPYVETHL